MFIVGKRNARILLVEAWHLVCEPLQADQSKRQPQVQADVDDAKANVGVVSEARLRQRLNREPREIVTVGRIAIREHRREMRSAQLYAGTGSSYAMQFLEHSNRFAHMLDHVLQKDLVVSPVVDRVGKHVEVVNDVGVRLGRHVHPHCPRGLGRTTADVEDRARPGREQVELVGVGQPFKRARHACSTEGDHLSSRRSYASAKRRAAARVE